MKRIKESAVLTLAAVRKPRGDGVTKYLFNERQQFFQLREGIQSAEGPGKVLQQALEKKLPVKALLDSRGAVIEKVEVAEPREVEEFKRCRILLEKPGKPSRVDVKALDPTSFNIVGRHLKWPVFRQCTRVVPNYKTAKKIFEFCASQSCHLGGPFSISPCIPFQYVRDGCYARAHKMRWIITTKYRYCCEKVFSFANHGNDELAVKADKWGGCCVTWWYHVAPLVRVRINLGFANVVLAFVIDPGMFDYPVLLSSWLSAQQSSVCSPTAHVSMYSIQPGSAYSPANYAGTAFTTDPSYTATDATLTAYHSLTTCP